MDSASTDLSALHKREVKILLAVAFGSSLVSSVAGLWAVEHIRPPEDRDQSLKKTLLLGTLTALASIGYGIWAATRPEDSE